MSSREYCSDPHNWKGWNSTMRSPFGGDDDDDQNPWGDGSGRLYDKHWCLSPNFSYIVAAVYISILMIVAIIMCIRARTRLRSFACFCTFLGLTIAVVGMLRAKNSLGPSFFWLWNFSAESVGIVALTYTIVSVGNGFYPMANTKNVFWRVAMSFIVLYALVAIANITFYVQQKIVYHHIPPADIMELRRNIVKAGIKTYRQILSQQFLMQCMNLIPTGSRWQMGVNNWTELTWVEREMYARPAILAYITHQMLMLFTCVWASFYLFIPLVRNHRHGPVGRPVDSDMMAVGVWYLSCLMLLNLGYAILNIYYCFNPNSLFEQQAQALDLCIRITIAPIFYLPAPPFLIRFYRQHFSRFPKNSNNTGGGDPGSKYGSSQRTGGIGGQGGYRGSFTTGEEPNGSITLACSQEGSRIGRIDDNTTSKRVSLEKPTHLVTSDNTADNQNNSLLPPPPQTTGLRIFHSQNRDSSSDSNKIFSQDFEQEDLLYSQEQQQEAARPDSSDPYYSNMCTTRPDSVVVCGSNEDCTIEIKNPLTGHVVTGHLDDDMDPHNACNEKLEMNDANVSGDSNDPPEIRIDTTEVTGTTGWEVGGWGHLRQTSKGMENSLSSPVEPYSSSTLSPDQPQQAAAQSSEFNEVVGEQSTVINIEEDTFDDQPAASFTPPLTGLQKQLAEHHSALLPVVLAMHDMDAYGPHSAMFNSRNGTNFRNAGVSDSSPHHLRVMTGRHLNTTHTGGLGNSLRPLNNELPTRKRSTSGTGDVESGITTNRIDKEDGSVEHDSMLVHSVDPMHWTKLPPSPKLWSCSSGNTDYIRSVADQSSSVTKNGEKSVAGFRKKWLAGRKSSDAGRQGSQKKFDMDYAHSILTSSSDDSRSTRRNSGTYNINTDVAKVVKPKDTRRNVFSKVRSGNSKGGDRNHQSQDMNEQDRDHSNPRSDGKTTNTIQSVEALASAIGMDDEDEEKGLQHYYPDPYESRVEFKKPPLSYQDQDGRVGCLERNMTIPSTKHPLSPMSASGMNSPTDMSVRKSSSVGNISGACDHPSAPFFADEITASPILKSPSVRTTKSSQSSKRSFGKGPPSSATSASTSMDISIPSSTSSPQQSSPLGALLSRSSSGSKKFGTKSVARGNRSKSDAAPSRVSEEPIQHPTSAPMASTLLPLATPRKVNIFNDPSLALPASTSLSPPPRQTWARSKSFQGTTSAIAAALLLKETSTNDPHTLLPISVDTRLTNERVGSGNSADERASYSDEPRTSMSSSLGSATSGSLSPTLNSISETQENRAVQMDHRNGSKKVLPFPNSSPASPITPVVKPSGFNTRIPEYRTNSLDRESQSRILSNAGGKDRTGFSTAAMDLRRANNRHGRPGDNGEVYNYHKANESGPMDREREHVSVGTSSNVIQTASSPQNGTSGFSYYGVPSTGEDTGRSTRDAHYYSAASNNSGYVSQHPQKSSSKTMKDSMASSSMGETRTNSLTSNLMTDDPWTQAMVARAQGGGGASSGGSGSGVAGTTSPYLSSSQLYSTSQQHPAQSSSPNSSPIPCSQSGGYEGSRGGGYQVQSHLSARNARPLVAEYSTRPALNRRESD